MMDSTNRSGDDGQFTDGPSTGESYPAVPDPASATTLPVRVLVIIDDDVRLGEVARGLADRGVQVDALGDPYQAESKVEATPGYAVILLDVMLPTHDVYRLCRRLRSWWPVPLVIATWEDQLDAGIGPLDWLVPYFWSPDQLVAQVLSIIADTSEARRFMDWLVSPSAGGSEGSREPEWQR